MNNKTALVIGAGIVGLAMARALAMKGYRVSILERSNRAVGASIRNFGMVWPIGQPDGKLYERALRSRRAWQQLGESGVCWHDPVGSLHLACHEDEWQVIQELYDAFRKQRPVELLTPGQVEQRSGAVVKENILGGLYSSDELIVDPREAIAAIPGYLNKKWGVRMLTGKCATAIREATVYSGNREIYQADIIFICSGADFETLYPETFATLPLTRCKLQMMRLAPQPGNLRIGPALCGGLSLIHYKSFEAAASLGDLKNRYQKEMGKYLDHGIHVMVSQNGQGALTVGDSHEYGACPGPFDDASVNQLILEYLKTFTRFRDDRVMENWNGVYAKCTDGSSEIFISPEPGVFIVNGLGGAGMTLSFGLAEEVVDKL